MPEIFVRPDTLDEQNAHFAQAELRQPVFLNSVPKSGSHLLRNILRMFVPVSQHYAADFIQWGNLQQHRQAFDPATPRLSWGHLFFADASVVETARARRIVLYRDPYDWVLARARFLLSEQFFGNVDHLRSGDIDIDELLTMMIFGLPAKLPSLNAIYELNAAAWLGARCHTVRFEDLIAAVKALDTPAAEAFFSGLLDACGIDVPGDWQERVRVGSDRAQSATARENLTGIAVDLPAELGPRHRALVDYQAPGLRAVLGYSQA
ncbi:hypothetical protein U4960_14080 [Altererythrobacter sp. H2]|uniref:hypothetical protein n=1 Tax=Altererythrobacter sp. H2 TaxID=3108391 RepID=UPI002B4C04DD|nr:hypothetical protein [Altererythrobacter sp. H2]WRK95403.1 hypothetical protein U4960_14080 [Altererythrobacter sp. H2]